MAIAHLPTTAKDGFRMQGLTAESGQVECVKQMAPSRLDSETTAGTTTNSASPAPTTEATTTPRGLGFVIHALLAASDEPRRMRRTHSETLRDGGQHLGAIRQRFCVSVQASRVVDTA